MADCKLPPERDEEGCVVLGKDFSLPSDCTLPEGVCLSVDYDADKETVESFSAKELSQSKELARKSTVELVKQSDVNSAFKEDIPANKEIIMADAPKVPDAVLPAIPSDPSASVGQAQEVALTAAKDIAPLLESAPGGAGVAAALIAVAGGGAAWKFYSQFAKQRHEERMEKMRLENERSETDHAQCAAERVALTAQIDSLSAKLKELEGKQQSLSLSMGDDLEDRLEKIEKKLAAPKRATTRKKAPAKKKAGG